MVIVAPSSNRLETGVAIHVDCRITFTHFKVNALGTFRARSADEVVEEKRSDAPAMAARQDPDEQQLGLAARSPRKRESDRFVALCFASDHE
jgi:hypothetical protein